MIRIKMDELFGIVRPFTYPLFGYKFILQYYLNHRYLLVLLYLFSLR